MTLTYLLIPRLQVQGANAQATWWLVNSTPVMACTMFGHALGRHLNQPATGVAILHHATQLHGEQFGYFRPEQRRGAVFIDKVDYSSKNKHALSLQPTATFSGEFSLIVRFGEMAEVSLAKVEEFLLRARLAGGQIIEHGQCRMTTPKELSQHVRSGYWLIDRRDAESRRRGLAGCLVARDRPAGLAQASGCRVPGCFRQRGRWSRSRGRRRPLAIHGNADAVAGKLDGGDQSGLCLVDVRRSPCWRSRGVSTCLRRAVGRSCSVCIRSPVRRPPVAGLATRLAARRCIPAFSTGSGDLT